MSYPHPQGCWLQRQLSARFSIFTMSSDSIHPSGSDTGKDSGLLVSCWLVLVPTELLLVPGESCQKASYEGRRYADWETAEENGGSVPFSLHSLSLPLSLPLSISLSLTLPLTAPLAVSLAVSRDAPLVARCSLSQFAGFAGCVLVATPGRPSCRQLVAVDTRPQGGCVTENL